MLQTILKTLKGLKGLERCLTATSCPAPLAEWPQARLQFRPSSVCPVASSTCLRSYHRQLPAVDHFVAPTRWPRAKYRQWLTLACTEAPPKRPQNHIPGGCLQTTTEYHPNSSTNNIPKGLSQQAPEHHWSKSYSMGQPLHSSWYTVVIANPSSQPA